MYCTFYHCKFSQGKWHILERMNAADAYAKQIQVCARMNEEVFHSEIVQMLKREHRIFEL